MASKDEWVYYDKKTVRVNSKKKLVEVSEDYNGKNFDVDDYADNIKTIDASDVEHSLRIMGNNLGDKIFGGEGNDTIYGGKGNDTLTGDDGADVFIYNGGKDVITDYGRKDKIKISSGLISKAKASGSDVTLTIGKGSLKIKDGAGKTLTIVDIYGRTISTIVGGKSSNSNLLLTDKASASVKLDSKVKIADASDRTRAIKITGNDLKNKITGGTSNDTLYGDDGNDTLFGGDGHDKIFGGDEDDILYGGAGNDVLNGGDDNDTLYGGAGNDTLTGGDENDLFVYSGGNDVITDYYRSDTIQISKGTISKATVKDSDVVFTIGKGSLTVKNMRGKSMNLIDADGKTFSTIVGSNNENLTITNKTSSPLTLNSKVKVADASSRTKAIKITGNGLANEILGGSKNDTILGGAGNDSIYGNAGNDKIYGGAGDDKIWGGKGNDSLWGDAGEDTFYYSNGDGKDVIFGFGKDDELEILGNFSATYNKSKKEIYFKVGSTANAITLKNFTATTFEINDVDYKISGSKLVKK